MKNIDKSKYYAKFELEIRDPVVEKVIKKYAERSEVGMRKYGRSLHEERISWMKSLAG